MQALSEVKRRNDAQIPFTGTLEIISTSEDSLGNTMSDGSYYLDAGDTAVHVTVPSTDHYTIFVPAVPDAEGKIYVIRCTNASSGDVIISSRGDSVDDDVFDVTLGDTLDWIVLLCQSGKWYILASDTD